MRHPKISVIIPNYNHARYLRERIDSVLDQTYNDLEILILDDASTDDSHKELIRYYSKPRVRIVVNTTNSGSAFPQWNKGILLAKGEYIWIAESDDSADHRFLETLVPLLDEHPEIGMAYCQSRLINKEGVEVGNSLNWTHDLDPDRWKFDFINYGIDELRKYLIHKNTVPNASAVVSRRSAMMKAFPVDTSFQLCGDWMHWGRMLLHSNVAYVARPLNNWRLNSSNSRPLLPGLLEWKEGRRILTYFSERLAYSESKKDKLLLSFADRCLGWAADAATAK